MWSTPKPGREINRLRSCRCILDCMAETQVEWIPYMTSPRALLNEHPRTTYIGGITCFDIIEVYLPERTVRQVGFVHAVRPAHGTYSVTFASPPMNTEAWSKFPYSARLGDQALHRASVPSEVDPSYVD
ncbi:uncharacterized protein LOC130811126 [Amaranthus tricolor]|uniref:uncharacterized protein LOC130811126 n=1 Tax=Amaranthus tricolor TaxID=29722 RepID=UPI00258AB3A2|nr:uncharacterized protein LOC130811126 [Amaranthus tricolor]